MSAFHHKLPFGAEVQKGGVLFRLWAPAAEQVALLLNNNAPVPMQPVADGIHQLYVPHAKAGARYMFALPGGKAVPDPYSRFQPDDVHKASEVIDPEAYAWTHEAWRGRPWTDAVIYEAHVGCFTQQGSYDGLRAKLDHLVNTGFTALELMPLSDFEGRFNWGYDGVLPFAPDSSYGRPDDLKRLIDDAHGRGLMVLLDVVYNHFGPTGNYLGQYAPQFFTDKYKTPWGNAINFESGGEHVRNFFVQNALYWLNEYRFDGLRFDAVHAIYDASGTHILDDIAGEIRAHVEPNRHVHLILENDKNESHYLKKNYDAQWNDDYHHAAHVILTGETDTFYADYAEAPVAALAKALAEGFVFQGQPSGFRKGAARGASSTHLPTLSFVNFLQNHDHIGNRADSKRLMRLADLDALQALTAVTLLSPSVPLLFMGEEWGSTTPFYFFCDYAGDLAEAVRKGRKEEFPSTQHGNIPYVDPNSVAAFAASHLDWSEISGTKQAAHLAFVRQLLHIRHTEIVPHLSDSVATPGKYEVQAEVEVRVAWTLADGATLSLIANLSPQPRVLEPPAAGRRIYSLRRNASWSVEVFLDAPA